MDDYDPLEVYRYSTLGKGLTDALDELVSDGTISPLLAIGVLRRFDKTVNDVPPLMVKKETKFKGDLHTYRQVNDVWTFVLKNAEFQFTDKTVIHLPGRVKIVACDPIAFYPKRFRAQGFRDALEKR